MKFKIEKYLLKKAEELAFITIKHDGDFQIEGYEMHILPVCSSLATFRSFYSI